MSVSVVTMHMAAIVLLQHMQERAMEGVKSADMLDRDVANIPEQQIGFCDFVALPVFK